MGALTGKRPFFLLSFQVSFPVVFRSVPVVSRWCSGEDRLFCSSFRYTGWCVEWQDFAALGSPAASVEA
jgi:hypothetical protein